MKSTAIDDEVAAFIEQTEKFVADGSGIEAERDAYDRMCAAFRKDRPSSVEAQDAAINADNHDIAIRVYQRKDANETAIILYFHGGGFVVGGLDSHDDVCAELCASTGHKVISVDYRLAPEHTHPSAFEDALTAFQFLSQYDLPIVVAGDSAGANLAAALCASTLSDLNPPAGQLLIYPGLGGAQFDLPSYETHKDAPLLTTEDVRMYHGFLAGDRDLTGDVTAAPLLLKDYSDLPPCVVFSAELDPLCDDGMEWATRMMSAGAKAQWFLEKGLPHGYLRARHSSTKATESFKRICEAAKHLGHLHFPYH